MLKHRKLLILAVLLALAAAVGLFLYLRPASPPESARLLPEGDLIFHANLKLVHSMDLSKAQPVVETLLAFFGIAPAEYRDFMAQTGVRLETDLDELSISRHDTSDGHDVESSEIFFGRFDQERLKNYLQKFSSSVEQYRDCSIYLIRHEDHAVRVALLGVEKIAVTNMASPEPMHGIIDRTHKSSDGPALLKSHYEKVPLGSLAWLIDRIPDKRDNVQLPGGFAFTLPADAIALGSLRYTGNLLLRADVFAQSEAQARQIAESANTHLALVRSVGQWMGKHGPDKDVKTVFDSIQVEQKENVAIFTATLPPSIFRKLGAEIQVEASPAGTPAQEPRKP